MLTGLLMLDFVIGVIVGIALTLVLFRYATANDHHGPYRGDGRS